MPQRLPLRQGKPNIAKGVFIQFAAEQQVTKGVSFDLLADFPSAALSTSRQG